MDNIKSLTSEIDFYEHRETAVYSYNEFIVAGRQVFPAIWFYSMPIGQLCSVKGKPFSSLEENYQQISEMLLLAPSMSSNLFILTYGYDVTYADNSIRPSIIAALTTPNGVLAEAFPYQVVDNEVIYDKEIDLGPEKCITDEINHLLAFSMKIQTKIDSPSSVIEWLSSKNFAIEFSPGFNIENIDSVTLSF